MKKPITFTILLLCGMPAWLCAQDGSGLEQIELTELVAPAAPAFSILGVQPLEINRPKTLQALEANVLNSFSNNAEPVVPNSYALEFSPFWLRKNPNMTLAALVRPDFGETVLHNLSLSLATTGSTDSVMNPDEKRMAFGFRTMLVAGSRMDANTADYLSMISAAQEIVADTEIDNMLIQPLRMAEEETNQAAYRARAVSEMDKLGQNEDLLKKFPSFAEYKEFVLETIDNATPSNYSQFIDHVLDVVTKSEFLMHDEEAILSSVATVQDKIKNPKGLKLEVAGAAVLQFPAGQMNFSYLPKYGVWLTFTYTHPKKPLEAGFIFRYLGNTLGENLNNNFDTGVKLMTEGERFSLTGEWIYRTQWEVLEREESDDGSVVTRTKQTDDYKLLLKADYKVSDSMMLSYSFGQNFDLNTEFDSNVINALGISLGLGRFNLGDVEKKEP